MISYQRQNRHALKALLVVVLCASVVVALGGSDNLVKTEEFFEDYDRVQEQREGLVQGKVSHNLRGIRELKKNKGVAGNNFAVAGAGGVKGQKKNKGGKNAVAGNNFANPKSQKNKGGKNAVAGNNFANAKKNKGGKNAVAGNNFANAKKNKGGKNAVAGNFAAPKNKGNKKSGVGNFKATDRFDDYNQYFTNNPVVGDYEGFTSFGDNKGWKSGGWKSGKNKWGPSPYQDNSIGPHGVGETKPCVPFTSITQNQINNPSSAVDCMYAQYPYNSGCCRSYWWLILDTSGTAFPSVPCVCNPWTQDPANIDFQQTQSIVMLPHNTEQSTPADTLIIIDRTDEGDEVKDTNAHIVDLNSESESTTAAPTITPGSPTAAPTTASPSTESPTAYSSNRGICDWAEGNAAHCTGAHDCDDEEFSGMLICCHKDFCACGFYVNRELDCVP